MTEDKQMTFIDFFAGIGGFRRGLELVGMKCIGFCERDRFAVRSYRAMYDSEGEWFRDDITTIRPDEIPKADIWTAGSPCQNLSLAGRRTGLHGERSGLFFDFVDLLKSQKEEDKPEWVILENVKGLLSSNAGWDFLEYLSEMDEAGYDTQWQVFNSRNYGVPQNRERVYSIGHLRERGQREVLPVSAESRGDLKQIIDGYQGYRVYDPSGVSVTLASGAGGVGAKTGLYLIDQSLSAPKLTSEARCITARYTWGVTKRDAMNSAVLEVKEDCEESSENIGIRLKNATRKGYQTAYVGDSVDLSYPESKTRRARVGRKITHSLSCSGNVGAVVWNDKLVRIRRLTPRECFRLQGFTDDLFEKAAEVNSDNQLYKQAGNGVTVNVVLVIGHAIKKVMNIY